MPVPIALLVAGAFAAGAGIYGGVQAVSDDDEETSGTDRAAGAPQPGSTRTDNQDVADIFGQRNQPGSGGGMTAAQAQQQAQSGFTPGNDLSGEISGIVGGGISLDQFAGGGGFVDQSGDTVAITDPDQPSPFEGIASPGELTEEEQTLLQLLTGQDPWDMSPIEQEQWLSQLQGREFPSEAVANTLYALEERPDQLVLLQQKLFATGYYGPLDYDEIRWGVIGPETIDAFSGSGGLLSFASRYRTPQGEKLSWQTLLDRLVESEGGLREALEGAVEDQQPQVNVTLQDPQSLIQTLDAVWQRSAGRKAPNEAKRRFVAVMHGLQRNAQVTAQTSTAPMTEVTQPSAEGQAQAFVDQSAPDETLAYQSLQAYQGLLQKIGG